MTPTPTPPSPLDLAIMTVFAACLGAVGCTGAETCSTDSDCFKGQTCSSDNVCVSADTGSTPTDADTSAEPDTPTGSDTRSTPDDTAPTDTAPAEETQPDGDTEPNDGDTADAPDRDVSRDTRDAPECEFTGACEQSDGACTGVREVDHIGCTGSCTDNGSPVDHIGPTEYCHCASSTDNEFQLEFCRPSATDGDPMCEYAAVNSRIRATITFCDEAARRDFSVAVQLGDSLNKDCGFEKTELPAGDVGCSVRDRDIEIIWNPKIQGETLLDVVIEQKSQETPAHPYSIEYELLTN